MSLHVEQIVTGGYRPNCYVATNDGGDAEALEVSINRRADLTDELVAHPGHGPSMPREILLETANNAEIAWMNGQ